MTIRMDYIEHPVCTGLHSRTVLPCWPKTTLDAQNLERSVLRQQLRSQALATFQNRICGFNAYFSTPDGEVKAGQQELNNPNTHQFPTSLVPPRIVVPLPGLGITYLFSFIVFAYFASPFTSTVCPLTGNIVWSGTSSFAPNPLAFTNISPSHGS